MRNHRDSWSVLKECCAFRIGLLCWPLQFFSIFQHLDSYSPLVSHAESIAACPNSLRSSLLLGRRIKAYPRCFLPTRLHNSSMRDVPARLFPIGNGSDALLPGLSSVIASQKWISPTQRIYSYLDPLCCRNRAFSDIRIRKSIYAVLRRWNRRSSIRSIWQSISFSAVRWLLNK